MWSLKAPWAQCLTSDSCFSDQNVDVILKSLLAGNMFSTPNRRARGGEEGSPGGRTRGLGSQCYARKATSNISVLLYKTQIKRVFCWCYRPGLVGAMDSSIWRRYIGVSLLHLGNFFTQ